MSDINNILSNPKSPHHQERRKIVLELHRANISAMEISRRTNISPSAVLRIIKKDKLLAVATSATAVITTSTTPQPKPTESKDRNGSVN